MTIQTVRLIWVLAALLATYSASTMKAATCTELVGKTFGNARVLQVQDVSGTLPVFSMFGGAVELEGPVCRVLGQSRPTPDSDISFEVWLPAPETWNGRYQGVGNGGNGGTMFLPTMKNALDGGYAVSGHDTGHIGAMNDSSYAIGQPERVIDFGWRSLYEVAIATKAIIEAYYGRPAEISLYNGCSTGGRQALVLAQRFPDLYDGIAAGAPANYWSELNALHAEFGRFLLEDPGRWVSPEKMSMLQEKVLEACGAIDGMLDDPASCTFDAAGLACSGRDGDDCLTEAEVASVKKRFADLVDEEGRLLYPGFTHGLEAELGPNWMGTSAEERFYSSRTWKYPQGFFADYVHADPNWSVRQFDLATDLMAARNGLIGFAIAAEDPDLSAFAERGGKLIQWHGWHDPGIPARNSIRYYQEVADKMGGIETVQPFYRLFMGTGVGHCGGGVGPNAVGGAFGLPAPVRDAEHDVMEALVQWLAKGVAPDRIVASRYDENGVVIAQRPWCPYPAIPVWDRTGDRSDPESYSCEMR